MKRLVSALFIGLSLTVLLADTVRAQIVYDAANHAYFVTGGATIATDISGNEVFVGKDNANNFATLPGSNTFTVQNAGSKITGFGNFYSGGAYYYGLYAFGEYLVNLSGGNVSNATSRDTSTVNITGGTVLYANALQASTLEVSGGTVTEAFGYGNSRVTVSGGTVAEARGSDNSIVNLNGGTVTVARGYNTAAINLNASAVTGAYAHNAAQLNLNGGLVTNAIGYDTSTVNIYGGNLYSFQGYVASTLNVNGGSVDDIVQANDNSTVNISGGTVKVVFANHTSTINIRGGTVNNILSFNSGTVNVSGGTLTYVDVQDFSRAKVTGGNITRLFARNGATANVHGGTSQTFYILPDATATLAGGTVGGFSGDQGIYQLGGTLNLYGSGFARTNVIAGSFDYIEPIAGTFGTLTGTLLDGTALNTRYFLADGASYNILGGGTQNNPLLPGGNANGVFAFEEVPSGAWFDPPIVDSFLFTMTDGNRFTNILDFPTGFNTSFNVWVESQFLGAFSSGQSVHFADFGYATGVESFLISNITPGVDVDNPQGFPIKLGFSSAFASFTMQGITSSAAAPEPSALALLLPAIVAGCTMARRRYAG